ncbi:MAG: pantetheine-phosphate adenylyltransferase [Deltaproteobacteria bacterium]|nr:pantetheine-phosphate adenylyltransferase [Deltaproteobacteria bacterium]
MNGKIAVYPGSFDPITNGHVNLIERALAIFDRLVVAVAHNPQKAELFTVEERLEMIRLSLKEDSRVTAASFDGLLVKFVESQGARVIIRGLRALSDFEYEFQMTLMNRKLSRKVDTMFLMTGYKWFYTSSKIIKEAASLGGSVRGLVPEIVHQKLKAKCPLYRNVSECLAADISATMPGLIPPGPGGQAASLGSIRRWSFYG